MNQKLTNFLFFIPAILQIVHVAVGARGLSNLVVDRMSDYKGIMNGMKQDPDDPNRAKKFNDLYKKYPKLKKNDFN